MVYILSWKANSHLLVKNCYFYGAYCLNTVFSKVSHEKIYAVSSIQSIYLHSGKLFVAFYGNKGPLLCSKGTVNGLLSAEECIFRILMSHKQALSIEYDIISWANCILLSADWLETVLLLYFNEDSHLSNHKSRLYFMTKNCLSPRLFDTISSVLLFCCGGATKATSDPRELLSGG
jgi:hypothetical protein